MGVKLARRKARHWPLSIAYRLHRWLPLGPKKKLGLYLDLAWIATRLAHETSFSVYPPDRHPAFRLNFLLDRITAGERVLDLGCAAGTMSGMISARGAQVVGIDHDARLIAEARRKTLPGVEFVTGEARDYLRTAPPFDVLVLSHVLEHLDNPGLFLSEFAPRFRRVYIEVPDFEASQLNVLRAEEGRALVYSDNDHVSEFDRRELKALIEEAGMRIAEAEYALGVMRFWCTARS